MKTKFSNFLLMLALLSTCNLWLATAVAQGTAFTYQGRLNDTGQPASGIYDLRFMVFDSANSGNVIAGPLTNSATDISNGLFTVTLDFGSGVFTGAARFLEIGARTNGALAFSTLSPRQELTPAPYAILAGDITLANTNIARLNVLNTSTTATGVPVVTSGFITGAIVTSGGSGYPTPPAVTVIDNTGSGALVSAIISNGAVVNLTVSSAGNGYSSNASLTIGPPPSNAYQSFVSTNYFSGVNYLTNGNNIISGNGAGLTNLNAWQLSGNIGTAPGLNFVGTIDNQPLELHVNGQRAFRLEPTLTNGTVNVIGGSVTNGVDPGVVGAAIGGGGSLNIGGVAQPNHVSADYATIAGGSGNIASGVSSAIGGGANNLAGDFNATIAGGWLNRAGYHSFIGSGYQNTADGYDSVIGGGDFNNIGVGAGFNAISGGYENTIQTNCYYSAIGGGILNTISASVGEASIAGGYHNLALATGAFIGGGYSNTVQAGGSFAGLAAGYQNLLQANATFSFIGGGLQNIIQGPTSGGTFAATIGGGQNNVIATNAYAAVISGGYFNVVDNNAVSAVVCGGGASWGGNHVSAAYSAIVGGSACLIQSNANDSAIVGGQFNEIDDGAWSAFIGGGHNNWVQSASNPGVSPGNSSYASICGGLRNLVQTNANYSFIGGGCSNIVANVGATIAGGGIDGFNPIAGNVADGSGSTIGGGVGNYIQGAATDSTIAGGYANTVQSFAAYSAITGGISNSVTASYAMVPGGFQNTAAGDYSFAGGNHAKANAAGSFVWADSQAADFSTTTANQFLVRCKGGVGFTSGISGTDQGVFWAPGDGAWAFTSDRNTKDRFMPVDVQSVLDKVSQLPLAEWSYKGYDQRHIGPMAQDFHAAFPFNHNETVINELDLQGVALAAIQGLNEKLEAKDQALEQRDKQLEAQNAQLKARLDKLEKLLLQPKL